MARITISTRHDSVLNCHCLPNANGFLGAGVDLAGFVTDWLVVPEGVLLPVEGLALEELVGQWR